MPNTERGGGGATPAAQAAPEAGWEHFAHDADIGVRGWGPTPEQAFEQAALALTRIVTTAEVRPLAEVGVTCEAPDLELLLVEWLNAVIFEMAVRRMLFGRFAVTIEGGGAGPFRLRGTLWGEPVDAARHAPAVEPKGATLTALRVAREPAEAGGRWSAACVVDV
ncbi:archease [Caldovatus aquaticus]|uniref:Archease n=1 Tax=Caldovatus aquaticus TaxID=2865671 RepID=A0ABS7F0Y7_9PROT|nr:archease [Caldovatus aquaticus]MBW8269282.1 archease [Caldovatus aquaticus]